MFYLLRYWRSALIIVLPLLLLPLVILIQTEASRCAYVMIIVAVFWMTEALPLEITSLIPVVGFPLLGVLSTQEVSLAYMNKTNMMNLGSLIIAVAIEHSNLHQRLALSVILHIGQSPKRLLAGFMLTPMILSMWINNLAVVVMMVPILNAILQEIRKFEENGNDAVKDPPPVDNGNETPSNKINILPENITSDEINDKDCTEPLKDKDYMALKQMFFLGTCYAGNIGSSGSPLGSGANLVAKNVLESSFREDTGYNFGTWVLFNAPGVLINTFLSWIWLQYYFLGSSGNNRFAKTTTEREEAMKSFVKRKYKNLGSVTFHEAVVISLFSIALVLWFFRNPGFLPGWVTVLENIFGHKLHISDATSAILIAVLLFVFPREITIWPFGKITEHQGPSEGCLTWNVVQRKLHWGAILLLGGGFALAEASNSSGLSQWLGEQLRMLKVLPPPLIVLIVTLITTATTEIASNTATSSILMPILRDLSLSLCINPLYLIIPATASCVYSFLLPVATTPNVVVFLASNMKITVMMKAGIVMNLISFAVINVMINTLGVLMFDVHNFPSWANSTTTNHLPSC